MTFISSTLNEYQESFNIGEIVVNEISSNNPYVTIFRNLDMSQNLVDCSILSTEILTSTGPVLTILADVDMTGTLTAALRTSGISSIPGGDYIDFYSDLDISQNSLRVSKITDDVTFTGSDIFFTGTLNYTDLSGGAIIATEGITTSNATGPALTVLGTSTFSGTMTIPSLNVTDRASISTQLNVDSSHFTGPPGRITATTPMTPTGINTTNLNCRDIVCDSITVKNAAIGQTESWKVRSAASLDLQNRYYLNSTTGTVYVSFSILYAVKQSGYDVTAYITTILPSSSPVFNTDGIPIGKSGQGGAVGSTLAYTAMLPIPSKNYLWLQYNLANFSFNTCQFWSELCTLPLEPKLPTTILYPAFGPSAGGIIITIDLDDFLVSDIITDDNMVITSPIITGTIGTADIILGATDDPRAICFVLPEADTTGANMLDISTVQISLQINNVPVPVQSFTYVPSPSTSNAVVNTANQIVNISGTNFYSYGGPGITVTGIVLTGTECKISFDPLHAVPFPIGSQIILAGITEPEGVRLNGIYFKVTEATESGVTFGFTAGGTITLTAATTISSYSGINVTLSYE